MLVPPSLVSILLLWHHSRTPLSTKQPTRPRADARARLHARERHRTRAHARGSGSTFTRHSLRLSVSRAIRRAEPAFRLTDGHIPAKGREMPVSVTPTLAPREADDTAVCARASCAGPSEYGHRSAASPPAARDGRGRLRRDGPGAGSGSCSGRSSSWRLHLHWTRASLVVLALLALVVAPGTIFAVAAAPDRRRCE